jgi:hypothetical protein
MDARLSRTALLVLASLAVAGCTTPIPTGPSLLKPARMSPDSVVLDMFSVRFPFGDPKVNRDLWAEVDEQHFPPALRERLARNGIRVGLVAGQIPAALSNLLELGDKPAPSDAAPRTDLAQLQADPAVMRRRLQIRAGRPGEIVASEIYPQLPLLVCQSGALCGQTYEQAQGILAVKAFPESDGRVRLELVPEVHHDQPQKQWVAGPGMIMLKTARPKRVFDEMAISAQLDPGAMLILSSLPSRPGSLGHYFFTDGQSQQKLLVVRLAQTQHDGAFSPPEILRLEEPDDGAKSSASAE